MRRTRSLIPVGRRFVTTPTIQYAVSRSAYFQGSKIPNAIQSFQYRSYNTVVYTPRRLTIFSLLRFSIKWTIYSAALATLYGYFVYDNPRSLLFIGEPKSVDQDLDRYYGLPVTKIIPLVAGNNISGLLPGSELANSFANELIDKYPNLFLGYILRSEGEWKEGNTELAKIYYEKGRDLAFETEIDYNRSLISLFPSPSEIQGENYTPEISEVVPDRLWALSHGLKHKANDIPVELQCSILKLNSGEIVIINPIVFTQELADSVKALGPVKALISSCLTHNLGISKSAQYFPDADLYGTDSSGKHGCPNLKWRGFFESEHDLYFGKELIPVPIKGQAFGEVVFYNEDTKSILGFTDTVIGNASFKSWGIKIYNFAFGMQRGPYTKEMDVQSFQYLAAYDREQLKDSIDKVLDKDWENIILGHGGVWKGNGKQKLKEAFAWTSSPNSKLNLWEKIYLPVAYAYNVYLLDLTSRLIRIKGKALFDNYTKSKAKNT